MAVGLVDVGTDFGGVISELQRPDWGLAMFGGTRWERAAMD